jgi:hypothetical protein
MGDLQEAGIHKHTQAREDQVMKFSAQEHYDIKNIYTAEITNENSTEL